MDGQDTQTIEQAVTDAPATAETSQALETEVNQTEQTKAKTETEQQDSEVESEGDEQPDKPRKLSRYDRMKRRMSAMATELDGYRSQFASRESGNDPPKAAEPKAEETKAVVWKPIKLKDGKGGFNIYLWNAENNHCYQRESDGSQGEWAGVLNTATKLIDTSVPEPTEDDEEILDLNDE